MVASATICMNAVLGTGIVLFVVGALVLLGKYFIADPLEFDTDVVIGHVEIDGFYWEIRPIPTAWIVLVIGMVTTVIGGVMALSRRR